MNEFNKFISDDNVAQVLIKLLDRLSNYYTEIARVDNTNYDKNDNDIIVKMTQINKFNGNTNGDAFCCTPVLYEFLLNEFKKIDKDNNNRLESSSSSSLLSKPLVYLTTIKPDEIIIVKNDSSSGGLENTQSVNFNMNSFLESLNKTVPNHDYICACSQQHLIYANALNVKMDVKVKKEYENSIGTISSPSRMSKMLHFFTFVTNILRQTHFDIIYDLCSVWIPMNYNRLEQREIMGKSIPHINSSIYKKAYAESRLRIDDLALLIQLTVGNYSDSYANVANLINKCPDLAQLLDKRAQVLLGALTNKTA